MGKGTSETRLDFSEFDRAIVVEHICVFCILLCLVFFIAWIA